MNNDVKPMNRIIPLKGARAMIANKMVASLRDGAQLTHHARVDMAGILKIKEKYADQAIKLSVEDIIMASLVKTIKYHPDINGTIKGSEIYLSANVDLCVAVALPNNLLAAPVIFGACGKNLQELRLARQDISARAKTNKLTVSEMTKGTFTVSNLGLSRVEQFTPIINAPQIAILGIGRIVETPIKTENGLSWRPYAGLSLTFDHRAIDGAPAADFLTDLCKEIEKCQL